MTTTGKSSEKARRGGPTWQRRLPHAFRGSTAAVVVVLLALTLPWPGESPGPHALRTELAGVRAELRAVSEAPAREEAPGAFGWGSVGSVAAPGGAAAGDRQTAMALEARAHHAERRVREVEAELESLLAESADRNLLAGVVAQVRSLVHPPRDPETAGRLAPPLQGVVTSGFGPRRLPSWGEEGMHDGIDIFAPSGTPVGAAASGTVVFAGYLDESGMSVAIDHGHDRRGRSLRTVYSHLSSIEVREGQRVRTGEALGAVGNTGTHSTGPHLHFEVRLEGEPVDPRAWL